MENKLWKELLSYRKTDYVLMVMMTTMMMMMTMIVMEDMEEKRLVNWEVYEKKLWSISSRHLTFLGAD
jgi:hypothetical protein